MNTPHSKRKSGGGASQGKAAKTKNTKAKGKQKASSQVVAPSPAPTPATPQSTTTTTVIALPPTPTPTPQTAPFYATAASARQNYALPNPNIHHRHRPVPLFEGPTASATALKAASASAPTATATATVRVERLQRPPRLFAPNETVPTNAYASAALITRRVGKAWSASVGAGPVWQIVEDLGWFRESEGFLDRGAAQESAQGLASARQGQGQGIVCDERARRPRVHDDVALREGWTVFRRAECVSSTFFFSFPFPCRSVSCRLFGVFY
jgi:transcription factor C subunit 6